MASPRSAARHEGGSPSPDPATLAVCRRHARGLLVRLLGPVDVVGDDGVVRQSGSALRRALLALLAVNAGHVLSSDWLMEHLWSGEQPDSGLRALRFHISRLRREVGDLVPIATRPGGYRLDVSRDSVDALVFEDSARHARPRPTMREQRRFAWRRSGCGVENRSSMLLVARGWMTKRLGSRSFVSASSNTSRFAA